MSDSQLPPSLSPLELLHHVEKVVEARIDEAISRHNAEKSHHLADIAKRLDSLEALIRAGFPHGDPESHRKVHEKYIEEANDREAMVKGAKHKVVEMSVWGALVIVGMALLDYIKAHLK